MDYLTEANNGAFSGTADSIVFSGDCGSFCTIPGSKNDNGDTEKDWLTEPQPTAPSMNMLSIAKRNRFQLQERIRSETKPDGAF